MAKREFKEHVCACLECKDMCKRTPCWGTPSEVKKIIDAGLGSKLMLEYRENSCVKLKQVDFLTPAVRGREGAQGPTFALGPCTFLDESDRCTLHDKGLKPLEGRVAIHVMEKDDDEIFPIKKGDSLRDHLARMWQTPEAQAIVAAWKKERGIE